MDIQIMPIEKVNNTNVCEINLGSKVKKKNGNMLRSGAEAWKEAIVISLKPFVLVSPCATMRWSSTVTIDDFEHTGVASKQEYEACLKRL